jgi:aminoglycoside 6'-N-acetyltransferase
VELTCADCGCLVERGVVITPCDRHPACCCQHLATKAVTFRPLTEADLPTVARWLAEDHVRRWWRDPSDLAAVRAHHLPAIRGDDPTDLFVVVHDGRDAGLVQSYRTADHPDWAATLAATGHPLPASAGIDYLIGEPDLVGHGVGTAAVIAFTSDVLARYHDVDGVVAAPQLANRPSCRVLEKAGYEQVWTGVLESDDPSDAGPAALYLRGRTT